MKKIVSQDVCLLYGLPGVVMLIISLIAAVFVGNDFGGNAFVCAVVFLACNVLLWLVYLLVFQYLPLDILRLIRSGNNDIPEEETIDIQSVPQLTSDEYNSYCSAYEQRKDGEREKLIQSVADYVNRVMAPFVTKEDLAKLCNEICAWCRDVKYKPTPIRLKPATEYKDRLKTIDFKHFIWNIGERLGADKGYSGVARAQFVKRLFPDELKESEIISIQRSLTADPDKGHIKLDRPGYKNTDFHN